MAKRTGKVVRCSRCGRRQRALTGWNYTLTAGAVTGVICPDCQSPEENAEAEINEATLVYRQEDQGRVGATPAGAFLSMPDAAPGTCARCRRPTDAGLATVGISEWHLAFASALGIPDHDADTALRDYTGADPGTVRDGRYAVVWRICRECARRWDPRAEPGPLTGETVPGIEQP